MFMYLYMLQEVASPDSLPTPPPTELSQTALPPPPPAPALIDTPLSIRSSVSSESLSVKESDGFISITNNKNQKANHQSSGNKSTDNHGNSSAPDVIRVSSCKPFQKLQFLVRDWQNYEVDWEEESEIQECEQHQEVDNSGAIRNTVPMTKELKQTSIYKKLRSAMETYLLTVIKDRGMTDLQTTREQITRCFNHVDCFLMPHPGFTVTKKNYNGAINKIETFFK